MPEDIAADRLAQPLVSPLLARTRAATGRVNLAAEVPGLLRVDTAMIDRLNTIDESLTIGTLPDYAVVAPKDLVATVKIIPFSVPGNVLAVAEALVRQAGSPLTLHPFHHLKVGLVVTELPGLKDSVTEKTIAATEQRVTQLTGTLLPPLRAPHEEAPIGKALESLISQGADLLLVVGASAVVDRRDVGPSGIVRAGGEILHFGMPVDPGNLICLGRIGARPGAGPARLRAQPEAERHRLRADAAVRRAAGRSARDHEHGRRRPAEGDRHPAAAAREGAGHAADRRSRRAARRPSPPSCWRPAARAAWRRTTSCWWPTAPARR